MKDLYLYLIILISSIIHFLNQYFENLEFNTSFIFSMIMLVLIDTALGVMVALKNKVISSQKFAKIFTKTTTYILLLFATHILSRHNVFFYHLDVAIYAAIFAREFLSIVEKTAILNVFKLPPQIMKFFDGFYEEENKKENSN